MDAELLYFLANENRKRVPVARVTINDAQYVTESETNVDVSQLFASQDSSVVTATTAAAHGLMPSEVVTIAGNVRNMLLGIEAIGADTYTYGAKTVGSVLVNRMKVAGSSA